MIRAVALGDSTTNCVGKAGVTEETAWRSLLARQLTAGRGERVEVINAGVDADVAPLALARLDRDVLRHKPDWVTVLLGTNDAGFFRPPQGVADTPRVPLPEFVAAVAEIVRRVLTTGARLLLCTSVPMSRHYGLAHLPAYRKHGLNYLVEQYAAAVRCLAANFCLPLADVYATFQKHPHWDDLIPDGIHPTAAGQQLITTTVLPVLEEALRGAARPQAPPREP